MGAAGKGVYAKDSQPNCATPAVVVPLSETACPQTRANVFPVSADAAAHSIPIGSLRVIRGH